MDGLCALRRCIATLSLAVVATLAAGCGRPPPPTAQRRLGEGTQRTHSVIPEGAFGYQSVIKPSNLRPIGDAAVPFANYLDQLHRKLHPFFAEGFLVAADGRPVGDAVHDRSLRATVELVIDGETGRIVRRGIVDTSGLTFFDAGTLMSIERAAPYGQAPPAIRSPDGNVYLHWELRRDTMACSTLGIHPYLLKSPPR